LFEREEQIGRKAKQGEKRKKRRKLDVIDFTSTQVASFIAMEVEDD
jgi:hypothetical protein